MGRRPTGSAGVTSTPAPPRCRSRRSPWGRCARSSSSQTSPPPPITRRPKRCPPLGRGPSRPTMPTAGHRAQAGIHPIAPSGEREPSAVFSVFPPASGSATDRRMLLRPLSHCRSTCSGTARRSARSRRIRPMRHRPLPHLPQRGRRRMEPTSKAGRSTALARALVELQRQATESRARAGLRSSRSALAEESGVSEQTWATSCGRPRPSSMARCTSAATTTTCTRSPRRRASAGRGRRRGALVGRVRFYWAVSLTLASATPPTISASARIRPGLTGSR